MKTKLASIIFSSLISLQTYASISTSTTSSQQEIYLLGIKKEEIQLLNIAYSMYINASIKPEKVSLVCKLNKNIIFPKFQEDKVTSFHVIKTEHPNISSFLKKLQQEDIPFVTPTKILNKKLEDLSYEICSNISKER